MIKLIYDFLVPDFDIIISKMNIAFSGHRGYHLKIEDDTIRNLSSDERREITDYLTGENISFEILGMQDKGGIIFGFSRESIGWVQKIFRKIEEILDKPNNEIVNILSNDMSFNFNRNLINSFLNFKKDFLDVIRSNQRNIWAIEGFGINMWDAFLKGIVQETGVEIDIPVAIDTHRLIRYPGTLHGKTGFKVQQLLPDEIELFNPLDESIEKLDPIVFLSKQHTIQKLKITEPNVPLTKIKGEFWGPYKQGEIIEVPHHFAVFLLCKEVAESI
jgi:DNA primase small subunit